jgi:signal transduction histidine kinase
VHRVTLGVVAIGAAGLLAGLILAFALSGSLARPLRRLADVAKRFGSGDLSVRAGDIRGPDEVQQLATSFDRMAEQVEGTVRTQREFVGNASHQLRTPLAGMKLRLESAIADTDDDAVRTELVAAESEVDRLSAIVNRLLATAARSEVGSADVVDLRAIAEDAVGRWQAQAREAATELIVEGPPVGALAHHGSVEQIIDNLLDNAVAYAPGLVQVTTTARDGHAMLEVRDHGPGIASDELDHVTERFYRGSGARAGGSGLGLAIVQGLAERDGGSIRISGAPDGGTIVEVSFPAASG